MIEYPWQNLEQRLDFKLGSFDWLFVLWSVFVVFHFRFVAMRQILISRHHIILARNKRATVKLKLGIRRGAPMLRKNSLPEAFFPQWALPLWIVFKLFNVWRKMWFTLEVPHSTWAEFYFLQRALRNKWTSSFFPETLRSAWMISKLFTKKANLPSRNTLHLYRLKPAWVDFPGCQLSSLQRIHFFAGLWDFAYKTWFGFEFKCFLRLLTF